MPIGQSNLEGKKPGNIILSECELYYKATFNKTAWYWHKKHINQWKRMDNSEINPCTYDQLIYSVTKKNEILPLATTWMDPEGIFLSETSQTEKDKYCLCMWNLKN